ncbi:ABC transporter permease [Streptomyces sp. JNUCC 64]
MSPTAVLRSEWIKIRSLRAALGALVALFAVTLVLTVPLYAPEGPDGTADGADRLAGAFFALEFAQVAALVFGTTAMSSEYLNHGLRVSLAAVPRRTLFFAAKAAVTGGAALVVGLVTAFAAFLLGQALPGGDGVGLGEPGAVRACVGAGARLALTALLAVGVTALVRGGTAAFAVLVPLMLIVSFVTGDAAGGVAPYLPDMAGRQVLLQDPTGPLGPWSGLGVAALWSAAALLAGGWSVRRRDA